MKNWYYADLNTVFVVFSTSPHESKMLKMLVEVACMLGQKENEAYHNDNTSAYVHTTVYYDWGNIPGVLRRKKRLDFSVVIT